MSASVRYKLEGETVTGRVYRLVRKDDTLTAFVENMAIARVVGMGTTGPTLQTRNSRGGWHDSAGVDDRDAHSDLLEYVELASWVISEVRRRRRKEPA